MRHLHVKLLIPRHPHSSYSVLMVCEQFN